MRGREGGEGRGVEGGRGGEGRGGEGRGGEGGREGGEGGREGRKEGWREGGSSQVPERDTPIHLADYLSCISPCHERI